jgi:hypothetical protein
MDNFFGPCRSIISCGTAHEERGHSKGLGKSFLTYSDDEFIYRYPLKKGVCFGIIG